jgi:TRAP-type uncharacterized transport system fused permease subunit
MNRRNLAVPMTVVGILWLLDAPRWLGLVIITEQYLALMIGLATFAGLLILPLRGRLQVLDWIGSLAGLATWLWLAVNYEAWLLDPINRGPEKWIPAVVALAATLEATRRHCGMVLACLAVAFIVYGLGGTHLPGILSAVDIPWKRFILYL